jgi:hypothetical protein
MSALSGRFNERSPESNPVNIVFIWAAVLLILTFIVGLLFFGLPLWNVWRAELSGRATLAMAESSRRVLVTQAQAERDAATLQAEAIAIVGRAAKDYPEYRHQEFIGAFAHALREGKIDQIIYVPTEASIPMLEAGRRP